MNWTAYYHCGVDAIYVTFPCLAFRRSCSSNTARGVLYLLQTVSYCLNYLIHSTSLTRTVKEPCNRQGRRKAVEYTLNFDKDLISIRSVRCDYNRPYGVWRNSPVSGLGLCSEDSQMWRLKRRDCQPSPNSQLPTHNLEEKVSAFMTGWSRYTPKYLVARDPGATTPRTQNNCEPLSG
jgi:hypothetical protein